MVVCLPSSLLLFFIFIKGKLFDGHFCVLTFWSLFKSFNHLRHEFACIKLLYILCKQTGFWSLGLVMKMRHNDHKMVTNCLIKCKMI